MEVTEDFAPRKVLDAFGLKNADFTVERVGTGHIHETYKLVGRTPYILQRVNKNVFREPEIISSNLRHASEYLKRNFPDYLFLQTIPTNDGKEMLYDQEGFPWRLFPFIENTVAFNSVESTVEAHSAACEFARLTRCLDKISVSLFRETIPGFHDLGLRYEQFDSALAGAATERQQQADDCIDICQRMYYLVERYRDLISTDSLKVRITHNDTKINNILFDTTSRKAVCVIDLDTLMPGYFIYDLGDMVRTFVSPVSEEEKDISRIVFRKEIYDALLAGYLSEMSAVMSPGEKEAIPFAGKMMTYIMALRFLTDFLNGDTYYHTTYPGQNLVRARNQLRFLQKLEIALPE
jgi:Ser/Thr protein kinase RdoA (MazF antagonist)